MLPLVPFSAVWKVSSHGALGQVSEFTFLVVEQHMPGNHWQLGCRYHTGQFMLTRGKINGTVFGEMLAFTIKSLTFFTIFGDNNFIYRSLPKENKAATIKNELKIYMTASFIATTK